MASMNNMLTLQQCMGESETANASLQSVLSDQQEFHVEPHKNLPLALNGEVAHVLHNGHLQLHHSSHLHCVPPPQQPIMGPDDGSRNSLVYYGNQPQVNMAHESPSHVSCDSPSHLAYNPMGHMTHNVPMHVAHNSPNHMSHGSPVHWQHGSPVPMPCNSPGNVPCHSNNLHLAHSSPGHGSCNSPVHMSCNGGLHMPHNSPVHMSQGSPSPQSASHGQANPAPEGSQSGGFMAPMAERCKFCGVELPMDTLAVVAHFNSHWRQPEAEACSYIPAAMNNRAPHNPQFNVMHKYNVNNRFMNSISSSDDPASASGDSHHAYAASFPFSGPADTANIAANDHNLKLYDHTLQREGGNQMVLQSAMHSQEGSSDLGPGMSNGPKVIGIGNGDSPHNRCSPLNLTGRSKLSASPLQQQPPNVESGGCPPSIENPIYMQGTPNDMTASVLQSSTGDPQLLNTNTMSNGVSYQTMYPAPAPFFGASCPYNSSVTLPPQSVACKVQQTFSHNLDNVGLSIPVLSPNLSSVEDEHNSCVRRDEPNRAVAEERSSEVLGTSECISALHPADHGISLGTNNNCTIDDARIGDRDSCISRFKACDREIEKPTNENSPECARAGHISSEGLEKAPESGEVCVYPTDAHVSISTSGTDSGVSTCSASSTSVPVSKCDDESSRSDLLSKSMNPVGLCASGRSYTVGSSQFSLNNFLSNSTSMSSPSSQHSYPLQSMTLSQPPFPSDQSLVPAAPHAYPTNFISISSHFNSPANNMTVASINQTPNAGMTSSVPETAITLHPPTAVGQACSGDSSSLYTQQHSASVIVPQPPPPLVVSAPVVTTASTAPKPYKCSVCNEEFTVKEALKDHFLAHEAAKPFHCDVCGLGVCNQKALKRHKLTHTGQKPYKCDTCGRSFLQKHDLNRHMTIHDRPKYLTCEQCKRTFTGLSPFKNHKCKGVKVGMPYLCHICGDGCSNRLSWSYHMWKHTKNPMFVPFQENVSPVVES